MALFSSLPRSGKLELVLKGPVAGEGPCCLGRKAWFDPIWQRQSSICSGPEWSGRGPTLVYLPLGMLFEICGVVCCVWYVLFVDRMWVGC